jgi:uncharacterized membrane protein
VSSASPEPSDYSVIYRRNVALRWRERRLALLLLSAPPLTVGLAFAVAGAWLVLPFAGLEVLVLVWAFREIERCAGDYERITVAGDTLTIETVERSVRRREEFNRHWAQVLVDSSRRLAGPRITVRSHGRLRELGRNLPAAERVNLAKELIKSLSKR